MVVTSRFVHEADFDVSILFGTLSGLDFPVWVFTQGKVVEIGFTWCGQVRITIAIKCLQTGVMFFMGGRGLFFSPFLPTFVPFAAPGLNQVLLIDSALV